MEAAVPVSYGARSHAAGVGWARHDRPCRIRLHGRAFFPEVLPPRVWRQAGHETCVLTRAVQRAGRACDMPHGLVGGPAHHTLGTPREL